MFDYVGSKIKGFAVVICWLGITSSVILGFVNITNGMRQNDYYGGSGSALILTGLVIMIIGSAISYMGALIAYGFGDLVENSDRINGKLQDIENKLDNLPTAAVASNNPAEKGSNLSDCKSNLSKAAETQTAYKSDKTEKEELYNMLLECDTAEAMLENVMSGYSSYSDVIFALRSCVKEEQSYGRSCKMKALSEVKKTLGLQSNPATVKTASSFGLGESAVTPVRIEGDNECIRCPNCGTLQPGNRSFCFHCGVKFVSAK